MKAPGTLTSLPARLRKAPGWNHLWAALWIEEVIRHGVTLFFVAPGSRSTPLAVAALRHPEARVRVHFDERGSAFAALGAGRATRGPAVWITTSGTAVANGLPAAVEAAQSGVPMLLLTADRPPELRETGANQTVRQPPLFASVARWAFDVPPPSDSIDPAFVLTTVAQAVQRATQERGPVHLNLMFREPLAPSGAVVRLPERLHGWAAGEDPYTKVVSSSGGLAEDDAQQLAIELSKGRHGVVIVGATDDPDLAPAAAELANQLGWPLLADVVSQGRLGTGVEVPYYDLVLGSDRFCAAHSLDAVIHLGARATSKRLLRHVSASSPGTYVVIRPGPERFDPTHRATHRVQADPVRAAKALTVCLTAPESTRWRSRWRRASDVASRVIEEALGAEPRSSSISELFVARTLSRLTPEGHGLVAAASMPIRDLDAVGTSEGPRLWVAANRGASGIDGTVATAVGVAEGLLRPVTVLVGDLAALHDINSLALLRQGPPITVVAVNNDGGGIFHFLPIAEHGDDVFEEGFGVPHGLRLEHAARMMELPYAAPETPAAFETVYSNAVQSGCSSMIEVMTDRAANRLLHDDLLVAVDAAVTEALDLSELDEPGLGRRAR